MDRKVTKATEMLKTARLKKSYSQQQVAVIAGVHVRQYQRLEYGERAMKSIDAFSNKAAEYDERFKKADARLSKLQAERKEHLARSRSITAFAEGLLKQPLVLEQWDDQLWNLLVLKAVVSSDGTVAFTFKGENTITVRIE